MLQRSSEWVGLKKKLDERQQTPTLVSEREIWWATSEAPRVKAVGRVAKPLKPATARDPGVANIALLVSLVAGVISTFVIVKTAAVKEHHWDVLRDQARISIADANARALEAQAQLAQFKAPRTMTEAQARHFIEEASKYSGMQADIRIIGDTSEPIGIGQIIFRLLEIILAAGKPPPGTGPEAGQ